MGIKMANKDKRFEKTEYLIKSTFFDMVKNNKKITVSEIAKKANIDRKTFYLHYDTVESLYGTFIEDAAKSLIEELDRLDFYHSKDSIKTFVQAYRKIFISYKDLFYAINNNKQFIEYIEFNNKTLTPYLNEYLNKNKNKKYAKKESLYDQFFYDGVIRFQQRFIQGELNLTLDEYFIEIEKIARTFAGLYSKRIK